MQMQKKIVLVTKNKTSICWHLIQILRQFYYPNMEKLPESRPQSAQMLSESLSPLEHCQIQIKPRQASSPKLHLTRKYSNMKKSDPDWTFAETHGYASRPGTNRKGQADEVCICCLRSINKDPIPLCQNTKELQFLGYGYPLYFTFIKYAMIILLIEIVNYTGIELYNSININHDFCIRNTPKLKHEEEEIFCTSFMILLSNIHELLANDEHVVRLSSFVTLLLVLVYVRDQFTKSWKYYDERRTSYADFSILVENLPGKTEGMTIGRRLRQFLGDENLFPESPEIAKINLIGQSELYWEIEEKINDEIVLREKSWEKIAEIEQKMNGEGGCCRQDEDKLRQELNAQRDLAGERNERIQKLQAEMIEEKERLERLLQNEDIDCHTAIICFQTQDQAEHVRTRFEQLTQAEIADKLISSKVTICQSPEPTQINWEFISYSSAHRLPRRILSWVVFVLLLAALTVGIFFLFQYKGHQVAELDHAAATPIVYCSIIGIMLFNKFVLAEVIHHLVDFEMPKTGSELQFSFMIKYSLGLFFTTAVMTVLVEGLVEKNVYEQKYGIVEEETLMFFFSSFFVPLIWLVNPWYLWRTYQRNKHLNKTKHLTQQKANKLMEDPEYLMGKRYGQLLQMSWFTFLYSCVIPFGSILIFIGFGLYYWIDKYNLLRRSSISQGVDGDLCLKALFLLEFILVLKPGGELIFDGLIRNHWNVVPVVEISVGGLYLLLPMSKILDYFNSQQFMASEVSYKQFKTRNILSYELFNPITKDSELSTFFEEDGGKIGEGVSNKYILKRPQASED